MIFYVSIWLGNTEWPLAKEAENMLWKVRRYLITDNTGWIEIRSVPEAREDLAAYQVELAWLNKYPMPNGIIVDRSKNLSRI